MRPFNVWRTLVKQGIALVAGLGMGVVSEPALAQRIGLFFDPEAKTCSQEIGLYEYGDLWVIVFDLNPGVQVVGAEFGIHGAPSNWNYYFNGPATCLPYLAGPEYVLLGYQQPLSASGNVLTLGRISFFSLSQVSETTLRLGTGRGSYLEMPTVILRAVGSGCAGASTFEFRPIPVAEGATVVINGDCSVAVEGMTWGRVKALYRD